MGIPDYASDAYTAQLKQFRDENADVLIEIEQTYKKAVSDGSTAIYYQLPVDSKELQDLISHRNMNAQIGEIFRECYRYGLASHSDEMRGIKKILFYANAELERLEKYTKK